MRKIVVATLLLSAVAAAPSWGASSARHSGVAACGGDVARIAILARAGKCAHPATPKVAGAAITAPGGPLPATCSQPHLEPTRCPDLRVQSDSLPAYGPVAAVDSLHSRTYVVGLDRSNGTWLDETDPHGRILRSRVLWTGASGESPVNALVSADGSTLVVGGYTNDIGLGEQSFVAAFAVPQLRLIWTHVWPGHGGYDGVWGLALSHGQVFAARYTAERSSAYIDDWAVSALELRTGRVIWDRQSATRDGLDQYPTGLALADDSLVIIGAAERHSGDYDMRVDVMRTNGSLVKRSYYGTAVDDELYGIAAAPDGSGVAASGYTWDGQQTSGAVTMVIDPGSGRIRWVRTETGPTLDVESYAVTWAGSTVVSGLDVGRPAGTSQSTPVAWGWMREYAIGAVGYASGDGARQWRTDITDVSPFGLTWYAASSSNGTVAYISGLSTSDWSGACAYLPVVGECEVAPTNSALVAFDTKTGSVNYFAEDNAGQYNDATTYPSAPVILGDNVLVPEETVQPHALVWPSGASVLGVLLHYRG